MGSAVNAGTKRWLVGEAEQILDRVQGQDGFRDQTSQLRNLVQIVQEESEVSVLRNFIRYQTGRKTTSKFWSLIHKDVIKVLEEIEKNLTGEDLRKAAIQQFFGYLVRHYVYLDKVNRDGRGPGRAQAGGRR
ncbi:MAG TPA: hypothetical protein VF179_10615 [Thermoanaerobaculia bacterium]|nr:hypothetical protein [Thermoanaerobaculia bacterium]